MGKNIQRQAKRQLRTMHFKLVNHSGAANMAKPWEAVLL